MTISVSMNAIWILVFARIHAHVRLDVNKGVKDVRRRTASVVIQKRIPTISNARKGSLLSAGILWNLIRLKYRPVEQKWFSIFSFLDKLLKFIHRILHPCTNQEIAKVLVAQPLAQFCDLRKNAVLVNTFSKLYEILVNPTKGLLWSAIRTMHSQLSKRRFRLPQRLCKGI